MEFETVILTIAILFGLTSFALSAICWKNQRNQRELLDFAEKQIGDLQENSARNKEHLETNAQRVAEQSRRIAWLETRVRQPKSASEEIVEETFSEPEKLNMTERRHRVITLASRGQNAETIAATLGMLPGEVELIINLKQIANAAN